MLTAEDNDLLCRIEGDAVKGQIMRLRLPPCLSADVAKPDDAQVPVRLLGEGLVALRDRNSTLGGTGRGDPYSPHAKPRSFEGVVRQAEDWQTFGVSPEKLALAPISQAAE